MILRLCETTGRFEGNSLVQVALFFRAGDFGTCDDGILGEANSPHFESLERRLYQYAIDEQFPLQPE